MVEPYTPAMDAMLTMTPRPCPSICRPAHLQPRKHPVRLIPTTVFQPLTEMSSGLARNDAPALFTMTSRRPHSRTARSTIAWTWSSMRTSTTMANERRPRSWMAFTTGSRCSSLRLHRATSAPARANSIAMDLPIPVPPPVTIAVLPSSENGDFAMRGTILQVPRRVQGVAAATRPPLLRQRDLGLAPRDLALDPLHQALGRHADAVGVGARLQLGDQEARPAHPLARSLGLAPNVIVAGALGLHPGLLDVGDQQHEAIDLAVQVGLPFGRAAEVGAVADDEILEVLRQRVHLAQVVLHAGPHHLRRKIACRRDRADCQHHGRDEGQHESRAAHRSSIATEP